MEESKLMTLIESIKKRELNLLDMIDEKLELSKMISLLENAEKIKIAEEIDPVTNKPLYSNELKRSNRLEEWKEKDENYNKFIKNLKSLEKKINIERVELEFEKNKLSVYRILSRISGE